jgi:FkbM family methyltransferase
MADFDLIQIGSNIGNLYNDHYFDQIKDCHQCIFVEPIPKYFDLLVQNYRNKYPNNKFIFENLAISDNQEPIELYYPSDSNDFKILPWCIEQLGSKDKHHVENHGYKIEMDKITLNPITLNQLFEKHQVQNVYVLSIDTEGHDYEILKSFDLKKYRPKFIEFEHIHIDGYIKQGERYEDILEYLLANKYSVYKVDHFDTIVKRNEK